MARPNLCPDRKLRAALLFGTALAASPAAALPGAPGTIATNTGGGVPVLTTPVAGTLDVKLNAARTVLQYSNFGIATGETVNFRFNNRSDLAVVHATQGAITVDGTLNSFVGANFGGNVWLLSAAGVFFGAGAHVDVGGLLASTSIPSNLLDQNGPVLSPSTLAFDFGDGSGIVSIAGGAQITGHGGTLAFIAPSVVSGKGAIISGGGDTSVLYGAAQRYTVRFVQEAGNDLDLLDFEVPGLTAGSIAQAPLTLAGTTTAGNVYVASVSRADAVRAVLDAQGNIGATSAGVEGGSIVLTAGGGIANRAAAPLFGDGTFRQDIRTGGTINASRGVSATATGDIDLLGTVTAGTSIVLSGVNVGATELVAGQDIIVRTGDAAGSSGYGGYGYGYGVPPYGPEGGRFYADLVSAGDDIAVDSFGSYIDIGRIVLAGVGADAAGDPLGALDAAGDGRRLALRTYGDNADSIYLGQHGSYSGIVGGTSLVVDSAREAFIFETGDVGLTSVAAVGTVDVRTDGALTVASLSGSGALTARSGAALDIGSATTTLDQYGNGQIVLEGGTSAHLGTGNAATDVIVVSNNGNALVGIATAGDDVIVRAFGGDAIVGSAFAGAGGEAPDTDGNQISYGEGSSIIFPDLALDSFENGRVIDLAASRTARVVGGIDFFAAAVGVGPGPNPVPGGNVKLGLGTGNIGGATFVTLLGEGDVTVDLAGAAIIDSLQAGGNGSVTSRTGDARVDYAATRRDLSVIAANGLAQVGDAYVGQDFLLSGRQVSLGSLGPYVESSGYGYGSTAYPTRDITIIATAGGFEVPSDGVFTAGRDLTIDVSGELDSSDLAAGRNLSLTGGSVFVFGTATGGEDASITARSGDLYVQTLAAGDDATLTGSALGLVDAGSVAATGAGLDAEGDGADVRITGSSISVAEIAAADDLRIDATDTATFGFGPAGATAGNDVIVRAAAMDFDTVSAGRDLILTAFDGGIAAGFLGVTATATAGRDLILTANEVLSGSSLSAVRDLVLTGTGIDFEQADAGRDVTATATAGDIRIGSATVGDDIRLNASTFSAGEGVAQGGGIDVGSAFASGNGGDSEGDGGNIVATGRTVAVEQASALTDIRLGGTGLVTLGLLRPGSENSAYGQAGNDIIVTGGAVSTGPLYASRDVTLDALDGGIDALGPIDAGRNVHANASGNASFAADITAAGFIMLGGDSIVAATLNADGDISATGRSVTIDSLATRSNATVTATAGDARVGSANVRNDLTVLADAGLARLGDARVGHDLLLRGKSVYLGSLDGYTESNGYGGYGYGYGSTFTLTRNATLTALGGDVSGAASLTVANDVLATATGNINLGDLDAGNDVRATAGLALVSGDVTAGRDALLTGGSLAIGGISAGRDVALTATASGIAAGSIGAVRDLTLDAALALTFDNASAGRDLRLTGNTIDGGSAVAGRDLYASAFDTLTLVSATAGDDVRLGGSTIDVDAASATGQGEDIEADGADIVAAGGDITIEQAIAAHNIVAAGSGAVTIGIAGSGGQVGSVGNYFAQAGNDIVLTGASLLTGPLDAGHDVILSAGPGGIDARGAIVAGNDVTANSGGLARFAATVGAGRDISVDATSFTGTAFDAERDIGIRAGSIALDSASSRNDVALTANTGDAILGSANVKRDLTLVALQGLAQVGEARVGRDLSMTGGRVILGSLDGYTEPGSNGGYGYGYGQAGTFTLTRDVSLVAVTTDVSAGDLTVARDIKVQAARDATLGDLNAGNDVLASAGAALTLGDAIAGRDITLSGGTLTTGSFGSGRDISLTATTGAVAAAALSAVRDLSVNANGITLGTASAGRDLTLDSHAGTLALTTGTAGDDARLNGATMTLGQVQATGLGGDSEGDGANIVLTGGQITAVQLSAATDINVTGTGAVSIGQATAVRDVSVSGASVGGALQLSGRDVSVTTGGAFAATAGLVAARDLRLTAGTTLSFAQLTAARDLFLTAATVAGGSATATRDLTVNATTAITGTLYQAGRNLVLDPNEAINVTTARAGGDATLIGASILVGTLDVGSTTSAIATAGGITVDTFTGQAATLIATGKVDLGDASGTAVRIVGGDLDVRRSLVASSLAVETPGRMVIGGTAVQGETGFRLTGAEIARLKVSGVASFYAGITTSSAEGQAPGGDLIVQDFAYDPVNLPRLALFADRSHVVDVQGIVAPSDVGGALQIGDANPDGRFRPASIYVSGSLGTAELIANCFGKLVPANSLSLYTVGDVIFGDTAFRTAVQSTSAGSIDVFAGVPATAPRTDDRLFAVTTRLVIGAGGKIVSQNTASQLGAFVGVVLIGTGANVPVIDIGAAAAADLSGSIIDAAGLLRSGPLVARAGELGPGGVNGAVFRFNGCIVGGGLCTAGGSDINTATTALRVEDYQPPRPIDLTVGPLTTVLIADNVVGKTGQLTVVNEAGGIVIRSVTVLDPVEPSAPGTPAPEVSPKAADAVPGSNPACNTVPGSNSSQPDCPGGSGPK